MSIGCVYCFYALKKNLKLIQGQEVRACDWLPEVSTQLHIAYGQGTFHSEIYSNDIVDIYNVQFLLDKI